MSLAKPITEGKLTPSALGKLLEKLEGNRSAAYLLVSDGLSEKCLYFSVGAIRLSSTGRRRALHLDALLTTSSKIEPHALARAEERRKGTDKPLEDVLSEMGYDDVVRECSTQIVRDELFDLMVWDGATYEFCEANPPPKIFDPRLQAVKLSTGVVKLIREAQEGVQKVTKAIGKVGSVRARLVRGATAVYGTPQGADPRATGAVLEALGESGAVLDDVFLKCRRQGVDAIQAAVALEALVDARAVDVAKGGSLRLSGEAEIEQAKKEIEEIEAALDLIINEIVARQRLAQRYQTIGDDRKAAANLRKVGEEFVARNRLDDAIETFRQVLKLVPTEFAARERIVQIFEKLKRYPEAIAEGLELARTYTKNGLLNRARNVFRHLIAINPLRIDIRRELIELLIRLKQDKEAVHEYEDLAEVLEDQHEDAQLLAVWQRILKLDPTHSVAREKVQGVARRRFGTVAPYAALAAGFLLLVGGSVWTVVNYSALREYRAMRAVAFDRADADDFAGAYQAIEDFVKARDWGRERIEQLRKEIRDLEADRRLRQSAEEYARARGLEGAKRVAEAASIYRRLLASGRGTEWERKAAERLRAIDLESEEAERLGAQVQRLYSDKKDREAFEKARELVRRYPWSDAAQQCQAPLEIRSIPPGATITLNQKEKASRTPSLVPLRVAVPSTLQLSLPGFVPETRHIDFREDVPFPYEVELRKSVRWTASVLGPIDTTPALDREGLYVGGRDQRIHALAPDGRRRWSATLGVFADPLGPPLRAADVVVVGDRSGQVTGLDAATGIARWRFRTDGAAAGVGASGGTAIVSIEGGRALIGVDAATGEQRWITELSDPLAAPATTSEGALRDLIIAPTQGAELVFIDAQTGKTLGRARTGARPVASPVLAPDASAATARRGGEFVVATEDGLLRKIARDGKEVWRVALPAPATAAPEVDGGVLYVPAGERLLALEATTGAERWRHQLRAPIGAAPAARGGRVYIGAADGAVYSLHAETGTLRWVFRTEGEILAQPVAENETVYVASTDFRVFAIAD